MTMDRMDSGRQPACRWMMAATRGQPLRGSRVGRWVKGVCITALACAAGIAAGIGCMCPAEGQQTALSAGSAGDTWTVLDSVTTRELEVTDAEGNVRIRIATDSDGATTRLEMLDSRGRRRVDLAFREGDETWLSLMDESGHPRWRAACSERLGAVLEMRDAKGRIRLKMGAAASGDPVVEFLDEIGKVTDRLPN